MKKWSGGMLILALAMILILRYSLISNRPHNKHPKKQSAYGFFNPAGSQLNDTDVTINKPHLINYEGLDDLFSFKSFSDDVSGSMLAWAQMRDIQSRSDTHSETAQGIKEAAIAWNDLLSFIETEKLSNSNISKSPESKVCPSFVNNYTMSSNNSYTLELPCGLVEDSSITLVGIPDEHHGDGGFHIELVGTYISGDRSRPPIILHYNISLPGDKLNEEPFLVQNTWSNEHGWGKEEKCPAHGNTKTPKVDGLVICNEQVLRSVVDENVNVSNPIINATSNISRGGSANFPFAEGNLFTSTLWVGIEGFHMTVNGRHETSFAYREKLEAWMVSEVKVGGGLDLLSAIAKDLPVSEDMDWIFDVDQLKAPPLPPRKRIVMLVGVFSTCNNFERRMALRRTWMQYEDVRSGNVAVRFFIGLHKNMQVNIELWRESQRYGDIQFMPLVDYYSLISMKTIAICIFGTKILPAKFIMKTDDDAFVRIDEVLANLKGKESKGILNGMISSFSEPDRDTNSKWYVSPEEWPYATYPPWAHGPGYIISRDIAKFVVRGHQELLLKLFKLEDVAMGMWIEQFKNSGQEVNYINDERFHNAGCEENYVLAHYQSPRLVLCLWEKLQIENKPICCE